MNPHLSGIYAPTVSGQRVYFDRPEQSSILIRDIAAHLAKINRFAGGTQKFYSVAQHSVIVSDQLRADPMTALYGLLHDGHEAYTSDITKPVERWLKWCDADQHIYRLKLNLDAAIHKALGINWPRPNGVDEKIAHADRTAGETEARDLMVDFELDGDAIGPLAQPIASVWPWAKAEEKFLIAYAECCHLAGVEPQGVWP